MKHYTTERYTDNDRLKALKVKSVTLEHVDSINREPKNQFSGVEPEDRDEFEAHITDVCMDFVKFVNIGLQWVKGGKRKEVLDYHDLTLEDVKRFQDEAHKGPPTHEIYRITIQFEDDDWFDLRALPIVTDTWNVNELLQQLGYTLWLVIPEVPNKNEIWLMCHRRIADQPAAARERHPLARAHTM